MINECVTYLGIIVFKINILFVSDWLQKWKSHKDILFLIQEFSFIKIKIKSYGANSKMI